MWTLLPLVMGSGRGVQRLGGSSSRGGTIHPTNLQEGAVVHMVEKIVPCVQVLQSMDSKHCNGIYLYRYLRLDNQLITLELNLLVSYSLRYTSNICCVFLSPATRYGQICFFAPVYKCCHSLRILIISKVKPAEENSLYPGCGEPYYTLYCRSTTLFKAKRMKSRAKF